MLELGDVPASDLATPLPDQQHDYEEVEGVVAPLEPGT
jgi:hypothetical protein